MEKLSNYSMINTISLTMSIGIIGDSSVGKMSLANAFLSKIYNPELKTDE
jgi:GTPase SAR1 family protein